MTISKGQWNRTENPEMDQIYTDPEISEEKVNHSIHRVGTLTSH